MNYKFGKAIQQTKYNSILVYLHITPNSKNQYNNIQYNKWRDTIDIKLLSIPKNGKANKELLILLSNIFSIKMNDINIKFGIHNENKIIEIKNIDYNDLLEKLSNYINIKN